jgi:glycosyltransferase involved in cell wall biosynthesis
MRETEIPPVSVVLPFFNGAAFVQRALNSVVQQSITPVEIIIVDDGSAVPADGVLTLPSDINCRIIRLETNQGAAAARNIGVKAAIGEWIAFLDVDDEWRPRKLEIQLGQMISEQKLASVTSYAIHREQGGTPEIFRVDDVLPLRDALSLGCSLSPGSTLMVAKSFFNDIGPFDNYLRRLEDWDWLIRVSARNSLLIAPDVLADIHVSDQKGGSYLPMVLSALNVIQSRYIDFFSEGGPKLRRRFLSTIHFERAAAFHRVGNNFQAFWRVLIALWLCPPQARRVMRRLVQKFLRN